MPTYKTLDDYRVSPTPNAFRKIHAMISADFKNGVIDQHNYDELLEDLRDEIQEGRTERALSGW
jgi:hypothetical protein